jgi:hypothetical protein
LWFQQVPEMVPLYTNNIWFILYACFVPKVTCMPIGYHNNMLTSDNN